MAGPSPAPGFLEQAEAAMADGQSERAAALFHRAVEQARLGDDPDRWARAVLGVAAQQRFGADPGQLPALLAEALAAQLDDPPRVRLAAALARTWAYAGQPRRSAPFAAQALGLARRNTNPGLLADALDAALTAHWGPEELAERGRLVAELDEVTAHLLEPDARLQAHLWGLSVAFEHLDILQLNRQARALELLGEESPKARFFAASRRLVLDLMRGRLDTAGVLIRTAEDAAGQAHLPDGPVVIHAMRGYLALHAGDADGCARAAGFAEALAESEGLITLAAEAAPFWVAAGRLDRAAALASRFEGRVLDDLPRDVDWLLVMQCVLQTALATGQRDLIAQIVPLLTPFAGRAVVNAGAVMFHGVTDDPLARAQAMLGDREAAARLHVSAVAAYERAGAHWWLRRLLAHPVEGAAGSGSRPEPPPPLTTVFRRAPDGWEVGPEARPFRLPDLRGLAALHLLVSRPGQEIRALDLVGPVPGRPTVVQPGVGALLDEKARRAYRARLRDLDEELAEAESWADFGRTGRLRAEREALIAELTSAFGLGGTPRNPGSSGERARVAVRKAIVTALDRIALVDPATARHLRGTVRTGLYCVYEPDPDQPRSWRVT